jgi:diaminopimelate epimerase
MRLAFAKYEGLGNDFILIDAEHAPLSNEVAIRLCDRHRGVGADGVLIVGREPSMRVINADGSLPEMCGNGLRCVALHLARLGLVGEELFEVETDAGPHRCRVLTAGESGVVEVQMRAPSLVPEQIPVAAQAPVVDEPFQIAGRTLHVTAVSMGNPHAVVFDDVGQSRLQLGPALAHDARFPKGVNAGFARVVAKDVLELNVYERGAAWTQACGSGACAAAAAAVQTGRAERGQEIEVRLPGGALRIVIGQSGDPVHMIGPARHVFDGTVEC